MTNKRNILCGLFLLSALTFSIYSFAVNGAFKTMDDESSIVRNEKIRSFKNLPEVMTSSFFNDNFYYRPLVTVSFMKEYFFFNLNPVPYYINNIFLHIFNTLLVFGIIYQLTRREMSALAVAFLFALHPIHWEAVSNIPGRAILLCAFYYFSSLFFFLLSDRKKIFSYLSLFSFLLALLCKESAGVLPLLLFALLYFLKQKREGPWLANLFKTIAPYFVVIAGYLVVRKILGITNIFTWRSPQEYVLGFITFLDSVIIDLRLLLFPVDLYFDRSHPVFLNFTEPGVFWTVAFFVGLGVLIWKKRNVFTGLEKFMIAWFFIELFPVSQIVSTIGVQPGYISAAEHFLYTPSVGFFALIVLFYERFKARNVFAKWLSPAVLNFMVGGFMTFLVLLTVQYSLYSSAEILMFERTLSINPTNTRIRNSLALAYAKHNRFEEAEKSFREVLKREPLNDRARIGLGKALCDQGKYWDGIREYEKAQEPGRLKDLLEENMRSTLLFLVSRYEHILLKDPENARAYHSLGVVYSKLGNPNKAVANYERALSFNPNLKDSVFNLASTHEILGSREKAITLYQQVLMMRASLEPDDMDRISAARLGELARHPIDPRHPAPQDVK